MDHPAPVLKLEVVGGGQACDASGDHGGSAAGLGFGTAGAVLGLAGLVLGFLAWRKASSAA